MSWSSGSVTGESYVGGLAGFNGLLGEVSRSYSTGTVAGEWHVGGLVGDSHGPVTICFWDVETSGMIESARGIGKTTLEMQDILTFSKMSWDIVAVAPGETDESYIWNIVDGQTYPFLSWQSVS